MLGAATRCDTIPRLRLLLADVNGPEGEAGEGAVDDVTGDDRQEDVDDPESGQA